MSYETLKCPNCGEYIENCVCKKGKRVSDSFPASGSVLDMDGTDKLCLALYGRKAMAKDYVGGSQARMLHDAADFINATREPNHRI